MGCSACGHSNNISYSTPQYSQQTNVITPCNYNKALLDTWLSKVECVLHSQLHNEIGVTTFEINSALGVIRSALKNPNNICYFASHLDGLSLIIIKIINSGKC